MKKLKYLWLIAIFFSIPAWANDAVSAAKNIQEIRISLDSVWVILGGILVFLCKQGLHLLKVVQYEVKIQLMY